MNSDKIRHALLVEIESDGISLRTLEARTGVSFSTLSRFLRGGILSSPKLECLHCYVTGQAMPKKKMISQKRINLSGKTFLITIEELTAK